MIYDTLNNSALYQNITSRLNKAFEYLKTTDLTKLQPGRIDLDGDNIYVMTQEYTTKTVENGKWEAHKRYIDVQYMVKGNERIDFALLDTMNLGEYEAEKDFLPMTGKGHSLELFTGSFVVFFPQDAHMPGLIKSSPEVVRKVVIKCKI